MAKSPEDQAATMVANLKTNTGKTLEQWIAIAKKSGAEKHGQVVKFSSDLTPRLANYSTISLEP